MSAVTGARARHAGCKRPGSKGHTKGDPWTCERCGRVACSRCVKYYWRRTARSGCVSIKAGRWRFEGARTALCPRCVK